MTSLEFKTRVGPDGVLVLKVPVGIADADREVYVTVRSVDQPHTPPDREAWRRFVDETAGAWKGGPLTRAPQGEYEVREQRK